MGTELMDDRDSRCDPGGWMWAEEGDGSRRRGSRGGVVGNGRKIRRSTTSEQQGCEDDCLSGTRNPRAAGGRMNKSNWRKSVAAGSRATIGREGVWKEMQVWWVPVKPVVDWICLGPRQGVPPTVGSYRRPPPLTGPNEP
jgi:hypothetical protein